MVVPLLEAGVLPVELRFLDDPGDAAVEAFAAFFVLFRVGLVSRVLDKGAELGDRDVVAGQEEILGDPCRPRRPFAREFFRAHLEIPLANEHELHAQGVHDGRTVLLVFIGSPLGAGRPGHRAREAGSAEQPQQNSRVGHDRLHLGHAVISITDCPVHQDGVKGLAKGDMQHRLELQRKLHIRTMDQEVALELHRCSQEDRGGAFTYAQSACFLLRLENID